MSQVREIVTPRVESIYVGEAAADAIEAHAAAKGFERVLLIASKTLDEKTDEIKRIADKLGSRLAFKVTGIKEHNPWDGVVSSVKAAREHNVDCIVMVGGGSVTDNGKITALLKNDPREIVTEADVAGSQEAQKERDFAKHPVLPTVLVPTTLSGTTNIAGWTTGAGMKLPMIHPDIVPRAQVFDANISLHTPKWLWVSTGVRALDHAVEMLTSTASNVYSDGVASAAMRVLIEYLTRATDETHPEFLHARLQCLVAAYTVALPISQAFPMGASHAIGHQLGAVAGVPHGHTSCVLLPYVLRYNKQHGDGSVANKQDKIVRIFTQSWAGVTGGEDASTMCHKFIASLGMPRTLKEVGVTGEHIPKIAEHNSGLWLKTNAVPITESEQILEILTAADKPDVFEA